MSRSNVETRWIKFGNIKDFVVLSDDVIAIASGIHVKFLNLNTRDERIEKFDSPERGRGASCLAGHPLVPMFAIAERRSSPKIFIFTYPGIRRVSNCILEHGPNGYLSCVFAGSEYLLTLTSFPDFRIVIWLWRTGENLTSIDTAITDQHQRITCSPSSPYQLSQLAQITGNLAVYEINVCSRIVMISSANGNSSSTSNNVACASWSSDGNLFQCDVNGNVTVNLNDGKRRHLVVRGEDGDILNSKGNLLIETFRSGIILVNRESQIVVSFVDRNPLYDGKISTMIVRKFYRKPATTDNRVKSGTPWKPVWSVQATSHPVHIARSSHRESLLFCDEGGEISELSVSDEDDSPRIRVITHLGSKYKFLTPINPRVDQIVAIDEYDDLNVLQCLTGQFLSKMCLRIYGSVRCTVSHPSLPLVAIGTAIGKFVLINLIHVSQPSVVRVIYLQRESIEKIRYSWSNTLLGVTNATRAKLFVIDSGDENERYSVLGLIHLTVEIIDFLLHEYDGITSRILILAKTNVSRKVGKKVIIYSLNNADFKEECLCVIELANMLDSLSYGRTKYEIIVVPYLTKQLHFLKIEEDFQGITLTEALSSGHQLRNTSLGINDSLIVTCSYDGLIIARSKTNVGQVVAIFMSHHRMDGGAKIAIPSSSNSIIVSLGRNGDLVATKICNLKSVENVTDLDDLDSSTLRSEDDAEDDLTWVERKVAMNLHAEHEECAEERNSILEDFSKLREQLKVLLDANEHESTNVRLSISDFDLDQDSRAQNIHENIAHKTRLREKLECEIFQRNEVSKYLRKLCWDSMEIQACSILSINGKTKIDNFPMPRVSEDRDNLRRWENFIVEFQSFDESSKNTRTNMTPESLTIVGTTTHRFINETFDRSINQLRKCPSYAEGVRSCIVIRDRERKLKIYFNKLFEDMRSVKDRELMIVAQRLEEIERCALELKNMFDTSAAMDDTLSQPLWHYSEKPETIVTITDREISNGRAMTYLERDIRREIMRKREEDGLRLNDSFRERALEIMMDGLLEVRFVYVINKMRNRGFQVGADCRAI